MKTKSSAIDSDVMKSLAVVVAMRVLIISFLLTLAVPIYGETYQQNFDLPPIELNASQLGTILKTLSESIARANPVTSNSYHETYKVIITDDRTGKSVEFDEFIVPLTHLPSPASTVRISYSQYGAPISTIFVNLSDRLRTIQVEGASYTEVTGSAALLQRDLESYSKTFCGPGFRFWMTETALVGFMIAGCIFNLLLKRRVAGGCFAALGVLTYISIWVFPWERILPGFVFHQTEPSWVVR